MRYNQTKHALLYLQKLKAKGEEFIDKLASTLESLYPSCFTLSKESSTRARLNCFGLPLLIRVEVDLHEDDLAHLRIYLLDDSTPPELQKIGLEYTLDDLGNVNRDMTIDEATGWFGADLLQHLREQKIALVL